MAEVSHNIKKFRELKNYTQQYMADNLKISQSHYHRMESGEVRLEGNTVDKIADLLGVDRHLLYAFDEKFIFQGNTILQQAVNNIGMNQFSSNTVSLYAIDGKLEKLYEDKITLLEAEIKRLRSKE